MSGPNQDPACHGPYHPLTRKLAAALSGCCGVSDGQRMLVAVSGGADSVALLHGLAVLGPRRTWNLDLVVGHVQHHLRGAQAEADAAFVEQLANELGLPFVRRDVRVCESDTGNVEHHARQLRYAALAEMAREVETPCIATAHHAEDQLETMLMRMIRGSGMQGMRGIAWRRGLEDRRLIRPMLRVTRAQARDLLGALGQSWREDPTNADTNRTRARLRAEVVPVLQQLSRHSAQHAVSLADEARQCNALINHLAEDVESKDQSTFDRPTLARRSRPVLARLLRNRLTALGVPADTLSREPVNALIRAIRDGEGGQREFHFANGLTLSLTAETLTVTKPQ